MLASVKVRERPTDGFGARPGSRITDNQAQVIGPWLEELGPKDAQEIVEAAASAAAPDEAHNYFTWNDEQAGKLWRRHEARTLARSIVIKMVSVDSEGNEVEGPPTTFPAFYAVRESEDSEGTHEDSLQRVYVSYQLVNESQDYRTQVIQDATRELASYRRKYEGYRELFAAEAPALDEVFRAIANLEKEDDEEE